MEKFYRLGLAFFAAVSASGLADASDLERRVRIALAVILGLVAIMPWEDQT